MKRIIIVLALMLIILTGCRNVGTLIIVNNTSFSGMELVVIEVGDEENIYWLGQGDRLELERFWGERESIDIGARVHQRPDVRGAKRTWRIGSGTKYEVWFLEEGPRGESLRFR